MARESLFSPDYDNMITRIATERCEVRMQTNSKEDARKLRYRFYKYRTALRNSSIQERRALAQVADCIMVTTEAATVIYNHRNNSPESLMLRQALEAAGWTQEKHEQAMRKISTEYNLIHGEAKTPSAATPVDPNRFSPDDFTGRSDKQTAALQKLFGKPSTDNPNTDKTAETTIRKIYGEEE